MVDKVVATEAALELIETLKQKYGELFFHQSGGCCDNSAANCFLPGELTIGAQDVYLGDIGGVPFYIGVTEGHGGTFSLEGPEGKAFLTRSRLFTDEEWAEVLGEEMRR